MPDAPDASPAALPALQTAARLVAAGHLAEADEALRRLVAEAPAYAAAHALLARVLESDGQPAAALDAWHRAAFLVPSSPLVHRERQRLLGSLPPADEAGEPEDREASASEGVEPAEGAEASAGGALPAPDEISAREPEASAEPAGEQPQTLTEDTEPSVETEPSGDEAQPSHPEASRPKPKDEPESPQDTGADEPAGLPTEGYGQPYAPDAAALAQDEREEEPDTQPAATHLAEETAGEEPTGEPSGDASYAPPFGTHAEGAPSPFDAPEPQEQDPGEPARWAEEDPEAFPAWGDLPAADVDIAPPLFETAHEDGEEDGDRAAPPTDEHDGWTILDETADEPDPATWGQPAPWDAPDVAPPPAAAEPLSPPADFAVADELDALIRTLSDAPRIRPDPAFSAPDVPVGGGEDVDVVSETLARIYAAQHQFAQAAQAYEKLAAQRPDEAERLLAEAAAMRARA